MTSDLTLKRFAGALTLFGAFNSFAQTPSAPVIHSWLPVWGASEDKVCKHPFLGTHKPGTVMQYAKGFGGSVNGIDAAMIRTNDCKFAFFKINAEKQPVSMVSTAEMMMQPRPMLPGTPLKGEWWLEPGHLPIANSGPLKLEANGKGQCVVTPGTGGNPFSVFPNSIVIPDQNSAYLIGYKAGSNSSTCEAKPLVLMPQSGIVVSGGGIRNPGNIASSGNPAVQPATSLALRAAAPYALALFGATTIMSNNSTKNDTSVIIQFGGDLVFQIREALGLNAEQLGVLATEAPNGGSYEDYLGRPISPEAEKLSTIKREINGVQRSPGKCDDEEFERLKNQQDAACSSIANCPAPGEQKVSHILMRNLLTAKACLDARIKIMDQCFAGGDDMHRGQARDRLRNVRTCQNLLVP